MKILFATASIAAGVTALQYNYTAEQAELSRQFATYSYCGKDSYMTQEYVGATAGFVATKVIFDPLWDVEGFTGYLPSDESIFVVFEGTQSQKQSDMDLDTNPKSYDTWPECNCKVHAGFNRGINRVWDDVLQEVTRL
jgi:Lipase (class 3)